jgi:hypothetical protein
MATGPDPARIVVFAGPSLRPEDRALLPSAIHLPPAEQGSVVRAVKEHDPACIAIIDGAFGRVPAVRHKEILWALSSGIAVFGAASMGALRAAELAGHGMVGVGLIYRWYRRTPLLDDDEVAVATAPPELGAAALGDALVNMRLTLRRCERAGLLDRGTRTRLEALAQSISFIERSYETLLQAARRTAGPPVFEATLARLEAALPRLAVDRKRADAVELLRRLAANAWHPPATLPFVMTEAFAHDLADADLDIADVRPLR